MMFSGLIPALTSSAYARQGSYFSIQDELVYARNRVVPPIVGSSENHSVLLRQSNGEDEQDE